ncbi:hypothetical protein SAMN04488003_1534 [Loktanella fryxellensis]|uniref:Uncharacterized protein n=1 Tax=Loktanella fryxellensis TaxID=245187 RepID=A0A1H8K698_9RHOB|nr:hypothetical protein [Loktanella fryxellensis]SEN88261.1 hypothetical protein SAMN04488003_1534 [Loktanella fryxellensis]
MMWAAGSVAAPPTDTGDPVGRIGEFGKQGVVTVRTATRPADVCRDD